MLRLTDLGCDRHKERRLILHGIEAEIMKDFIYNLQREGDCHTFICEHGHTHHVHFDILSGRLYHLAS